MRYERLLAVIVALCALPVDSGLLRPGKADEQNEGPTPPLRDLNFKPPASRDERENTCRNWIKQCDAKLIRNPADIKTLCSRAEALFLIGDYEHALSDIATAIRLRPENPGSYRTRARMLNALGRLKEAIDDLSKAIELDPGDLPTYEQRAWAWEQSGDFEKATQDYSRLLLLDDAPGWQARVKCDRGRAYRLAGRFERALADYSAAIESMGERATADMYAGRAGVYCALSRYDDAESDCTAALLREPDSPTNLYCRGTLRQALGRYSEALADYERLDEIAPQTYQGYQRRAWIWAACPDPKHRNGPLAVDAATKICKVTAWSQPWALVLLAAAQAEAGDFESAVKYAEKALQMNLGDEDFQRSIRPMLHLFRAGKPYRLNATGTDHRSSRA